MSTKKLLLAMVVLLAGAGTVSAQEAPKWSYIEGGFIDFSPEAGASDDGLFFGGSMEILRIFHAIAEYDEVGDYSFWNAGFGWHGAFGDPLDAFAEIAWRNVDYDSGSNDFSDDGASLAAGVRWMLGKNFELKGTATWVDVGDSDATFRAEGLFYLLGNKLGLGASFELGDADTARVFARWNLGR